MKLAELLKLKFPEYDFRKDILVQDDGQGPYIKEWNLDIPEPTQKDLNRWAEELDLKHRQQQAVLARRYPPIGDQLDMLYHDKINGTTIWKDTVAAIKEAHPKPEE